MWPDTRDTVAATIADLRARAARYGRTLRFGYRVHVVVPETEAEARLAADRLLSRLVTARGAAIRAKSLNSTSSGVQAQAALCERSQNGYVEENLWTDIAGLARAAGRPRSAIPIRCSPSSTCTATWVSRRSSSQATRMPLRRTCSRHVLPRLEHGLLT
jgi:alkanesulfonate monooxygenase